MRSFLIVGLPLAASADEVCAADGSCAQDEATLLQMQSLRHKFKVEVEKKWDLTVDNANTQCWYGDQCQQQGGNCHSGYCGDGVCCRKGWSALNEDEEIGCGANGYEQGHPSHHQCQPRLLNHENQCWYGDQCDGQGGRCDASGFCGALGVCCRNGWGALNLKEALECGVSGHGVTGMHTCQLPAGEAQYIGCFVDDGSRDLGPMLGSATADTDSFDACRAACDKKYIALQWGGECFCSDTYGNGDQYVQVADSECDHPREPCASTSYNCGGTWRQAIYQIRGGLPTWGRVLNGDRGKCNDNVNVEYVQSQAECEARAKLEGHAFYSFRSNANDEGHKCFSSSRCDDDAGLLYGGRTNEWAIYARPELSCNALYEAEDASFPAGGQVDTNHDGYTGTGFFNYLDNDDKLVWTLSSCSGGAATLSFRYALSSGNRPLQVKLNGETLTTDLSFPATGGWSMKWERAAVSVTLAAGDNTVELIAGSSSGANVDSLTVQSGIPDYTIMAYGEAACPAGKDVTTEAECRTAHDQLGLPQDGPGGWTGTNGGIPSACSSREHEGGGVGNHFHFDSKAIGDGVGREDLAPVCLL